MVQKSLQESHFRLQILLSASKTGLFRLLSNMTTAYAKWDSEEAIMLEMD